MPANRMAHNLGSSKRRKNLVRTEISYRFPLRRSIIPEFPVRSKNAQKEKKTGHPVRQYAGEGPLSEILRCGDLSYQSSSSSAESSSASSTQDGSYRAFFMIAPQEGQFSYGFALDALHEEQINSSGRSRCVFCFQYAIVLSFLFVQRSLAILLRRS